MKNLFLSYQEKRSLSQWNYSVIDESISTKILTPFWDYCLNWTSPNLAPNVITLMGLFCTIYSYYIVNNFYSSYPVLISYFSVFLIFMYQTLDALDGKHARKIQNSSPVGELLDHACDNISIVFLLLTLFHCYGIDEPNIKNCLVFTSQLIFLIEHCNAFNKNTVYFGKYTGPGEMLFLLQCLILISPCFNFNSITSGIKIYYILLLYLPSFFGFSYYLYSQMRWNFDCFIGLYIILISQSLNAITTLFSKSDVSEFDIIGMGLIMAMVSSDMIVAKMAKRNLHPLVVVLSTLSLFNSYLGIGVCVLYYYSIFSDIIEFLNIPMFGITKNILIIGVFDFFHIGHANLITNAQKYGNRIYVGVHSDEDTELYKRKPINTMNERIKRIEQHTGVYKVIPNTPLIMTEEFLQKYSIHIMGVGEEYNNPDDKWYAIPRLLNLIVYLPRTFGISTYELIKRIKEQS